MINPVGGGTPDTFPAIPTGNPSSIADLARRLDDGMGHLETASTNIHAADLTMATDWRGVAATAYRAASNGLMAVVNVGVGQFEDATTTIAAYGQALESIQTAMGHLETAYSDAIKHSKVDEANSHANRAGSLLSDFEQTAARHASQLQGYSMGYQPGGFSSFSGIVNHNTIPGWGAYRDSISGGAVATGDLTDLFLLLAGPAEAGLKALSSLGKDGLATFGKAGLEALANSLDIDVGSGELDTAAGRDRIIGRIEKAVDDLGPEALDKVLTAGASGVVGAIKALRGEIDENATDLVSGILNAHKIPVPEDLIDAIKEFVTGDHAETYAAGLKAVYEKFADWVDQHYGSTGTAVAAAVKSILDLIT